MYCGNMCYSLLTYCEISFKNRHEGTIDKVMLVRDKSTDETFVRKVNVYSFFTLLIISYDEGKLKAYKADALVQDL